MKKKAKHPITQPALPADDWFDTILDDDRRAAIPVGARFQADVPDWRPLDNERNLREYELDSSRWLGMKVMALNCSNQVHETGRAELMNKDGVGKGRPDSCSCKFPGSVECVRKHVAEKRIKLQFEIGPAFWSWKFNEMGEYVSKLWTLKEHNQFKAIIRTNPLSEGKCFLKPALKALPSQSRQSIVSYYFNVYLPRRMSAQIRSGCKAVDTDDEGPSGEPPKSKSSRKRCQADVVVASHGSKIVNTRFLTGRR